MEMTHDYLQKNAKLIKAWKQMDGSWYEDTFRIYRLGNTYYEVKDHACVSFGGTMSYYGKVTELAGGFIEPTHVGFLYALNSLGQVYIVKQTQGTPEELTQWAVNLMRKSSLKLQFKIMPLEF